MSSIPSTTPVAGAAPTDTSTITNPSSVLSKNDFLKLFIAQLQNEDPTSASSNDPSQMMQTMSQFSIIEQLTNLNTAITSLTLSQKASEAASMLGKTVSYPDPADATGNTIKQGVVDKVLMNGTDVKVQIHGVTDPISIDSLSEIDSTAPTGSTGAAAGTTTTTP